MAAGVVGDARRIGSGVVVAGVLARIRQPRGVDGEGGDQQWKQKG